MEGGIWVDYAGLLQGIWPVGIVGKGDRTDFGAGKVK